MKKSAGTDQEPSKEEWKNEMRYKRAIMKQKYAVRKSVQKSL